MFYFLPVDIGSTTNSGPPPGKPFPGLKYLFPLVGILGFKF